MKKTGSITFDYLRRAGLCYWGDLPIWVGKFLGFSVSFFCVLSVPVMAQVHIRESTVITPGQARNVVVGGNVNNHTLRFEFYWDGSPEAKVNWASGCQSDTQLVQSSSPIVMTVSSPPAGQYDFSAGVWA